MGEGRVLFSWLVCWVVPQWPPSQASVSVLEAGETENEGRERELGRQQEKQTYNELSFLSIHYAPGPSCLSRSRKERVNVREREGDQRRRGGSLGTWAPPLARLVLPGQDQLLNTGISLSLN